MSDATPEEPDQDSEPSTQAPDGGAPTDPDVIEAASDDPGDDRGQSV